MGKDTVEFWSKRARVVEDMARRLAERSRALADVADKVCEASSRYGLSCATDLDIRSGKMRSCLTEWDAWLEKQENEKDDALLSQHMTEVTKDLRSVPLLTNGRNAAHEEVELLREEVATLRARVAELEKVPKWVPEVELCFGATNIEIRDAASRLRDVTSRLTDTREVFERVIKERIGAASLPAPQGQRVATDDELFGLFRVERSKVSDPSITVRDANRIAVAAVARRVRAERPACLVARAVALDCDVDLMHAERPPRGWVLSFVSNGTDHRHLQSAMRGDDVLSILSQLLDEVEAARLKRPCNE
jgi:hypothetical protein